MDKKALGTVVAVHGPVIDVEFAESGLPAIDEAVVVRGDVGSIVVEVHGRSCQVNSPRA